MEVFCLLDVNIITIILTMLTMLRLEWKSKWKYRLSKEAFVQLHGINLMASPN